ncbi:hypothetical protein Poly24_01420 [Rosistilla carotiformis]|uniref:TadE-like domain-containing protein n=1 Tax=Rosistilla carotiformis TaxID=2528017 RepID=A0A518JLN0_9BACT|nr:hypothetical protein [Rosistilla carotiformis]QDV66456.1 hypothetical protein Poly24_01420 [Rosistilla carotiformis]
MNRKLNRCAVSRRRGAYTLEVAITMLIFLGALLAMLEFALVSLRYNALGESARRIARVVIVRGEQATPEQSVLGPTAYVGTADDSSDIAAAARELLVTMPPEDVDIRVEWLDADTREGDRVSIQLSYLHNPILPGLLGSAKTLSATTVTRIVH